MVIHATKGFCPERKAWRVPVRQSWALAKHQRITPTLQRKICCTAVETGSFEKASSLAAQWGCQVSDDAIRSCALALGQKSRKQPLSSPCARRAGPEDVLVIMMDGWMARHRGKDWGRKKPANGQERIHWHEIKPAVCAGSGSLRSGNAPPGPKDTTVPAFGVVVRPVYPVKASPAGVIAVRVRSSQPKAAS